jgi:hypothetical protein
MPAHSNLPSVRILKGLPQRIVRLSGLVVKPRSSSCRCANGLHYELCGIGDAVPTVANEFIVNDPAIRSLWPAEREDACLRRWLPPALLQRRK